jgi:hypothetical protein
MNDSVSHNILCFHLIYCDCFPVLRKSPHSRNTRGYFLLIDM